MTTAPTSPSTSETIKRGFHERYQAEQIERAAQWTSAELSRLRDGIGGSYWTSDQCGAFSSLTRDVEVLISERARLLAENERLRTEATARGGAS